MIQYLIFSKTRVISDKKNKKRPIKISFEEDLAKDSKVNEEPDFVIVEMRKALSGENNGGESRKVHSIGRVGIVGGEKPLSSEGWMDIEAPKLLNQIIELGRSGEKTVKQALNDNKFLKHIGSYTIIACGSRKNYWLESRIDVKGFMQGGKQARRLKEVSSNSRLKSLNWMISGNNEYRGNTLGMAGTLANLYGLGNISYRQMENFKGLFLMDMALDFEGESEGGDAAEKFSGKLENLTSNISKFLTYHSLLLNHNNTEYKSVDRQALTMRNEALNIQERIFDLQKGAEDEKRSDSKDVGKMRTEEEDLLNVASITFSAVTRLEQKIGTNMYSVFGLNKSLEDITEDMGIRRIETPDGEGETVSSLFDEFNRFNDSINVSYQMLRDDVNNTQTTLRNSLEVLRTFIEHQQRKLSDKQSKMLTLLTFVFACFGIADALSNLLAYYVSERTMDAMVWTVGAFVFSMLFSLGVFLVMYILTIQKALK